MKNDPFEQFCSCHPPAMYHVFGDDLNCAGCGVGLAQHEANPTRCLSPRPRHAFIRRDRKTVCSACGITEAAFNQDPTPCPKPFTRKRKEEAA